MEASSTRPVEIETPDGVRLTGELMVPEEHGALVVLCHGIPLSKPDPGDAGYPALARSISEAGYAALFVNFRGTGTSGGDFSIGGWYRDLVEVMDFALSPSGAGRFPVTVMAGFSAGGSLAIRYAGEHDRVDGVVAFAAPARFERIFPQEQLFAFIELARDVGIIRRLDFPGDPFSFYRELEESAAVDFVSGISPAPLLVVHGDEDELVPVEEGVMLFEAACEPREMVVLPGGAHRLRHDPRSLECLLGWIKRLAATD